MQQASFCLVCKHTHTHTINTCTFMFLCDFLIKFTLKHLSNRFSFSSCVGEKKFNIFFKTCVECVLQQKKLILKCPITCNVQFVCVYLLITAGWLKFKRFSNEKICLCNAHNFGMFERRRVVWWKRLEWQRGVRGKIIYIIRKVKKGNEQAHSLHYFVV